MVFYKKIWQQAPLVLLALAATPCSGLAVQAGGPGESVELKRKGPPKAPQGALKRGEAVEAVHDGPSQAPACGPGLPASSSTGDAEHDARPAKKRRCPQGATAARSLDNLGKMNDAVLDNNDDITLHDNTKSRSNATINKEGNDKMKTSEYRARRNLNTIKIIGGGGSDKILIYFFNTK